MSIIRQRRKNLIVSGLLGFLFAALILTGTAYLFRQALGEWLDIVKIEERVEPTLYPTIVAARPIEKGSILDANDVRTVMVEESVKVVDHFDALEALIGKKTLIDLDKNMPLTKPMLIEDSLIEDNLRLYEVSFVELPYHLSVGEVVDVRIAFPTGQEYVVLSHKEIIAFERRVQNIHSGLLTLTLGEGEALQMSSALVDLYVAEGARVYLVKYVDAEHQAPAVVNYPVNERVHKLLMENPNILESNTGDAMLRERIELNMSLLALMDEDNQPVYQVDMGTPDLSIKGGDHEQVESAPQVNESQTNRIPETSTPSTEAQSNGIGF